MKPPKNWLSFEEQLRKLKAKGMHVDDEAVAIDYLERIGYYRLSGYWYPMLAMDQEASKRKNTPIRKSEFVPGSRLEDAVKLYVFDKKLRLLALDALERIEMAVRVDVAYILGKRSPLAHLDARYLDGNFSKKTRNTNKRLNSNDNEHKTPHEKWVANYEKQLDRSKDLPFVKHHYEDYDGKLPVWVAIEIWDFGMLSWLFSGMKHEDREEIAKIYGAKDKKELSNWLHSLNVIRNISAHHSRLWNANIVKKSEVPADWPKELNKHRPFFYFCLMQHFLNVICPKSQWAIRFRKLLADDFPKEATSLSLEDMGTCVGWEEWPLWRRSWK